STRAIATRGPASNPVVLRRDAAADPPANPVPDEAPEPADGSLPDDGADAGTTVIATVEVSVPNVAVKTWVLAVGKVTVVPLITSEAWSLVMITWSVGSALPNPSSSVRSRVTLAPSSTRRAEGVICRDAAAAGTTRTVVDSVTDGSAIRIAVIVRVPA